MKVTRSLLDDIVVKNQNCLIVFREWEIDGQNTYDLVANRKKEEERQIKNYLDGLNSLNDGRNETYGR